MSDIEKFVVTKVKGFDPHELAVATIVFEGSKRGGGVPGARRSIASPSSTAA
jgi:hypothetical protein